MKRYDNNIVLAFGDTHFPYSHKRTFEFLADIKETYNPDRVVHMGDLLDIYSVSAYPKDANHPESWDEEIRRGRKDVQTLASLFPDLVVLESNHDDRAYKKSRIASIPREFLVPYKDVVGAPESWKWVEHLSLVSDGSRTKMFFAHTKTGGCMACAKDLGCTTVLGHQHSKFGASGFKPRKKVLYGVDAGCLVSDKGAPYSYNKRDRGRPIQGCCILIDGVPIMEELS